MNEQIPETCPHEIKQGGGVTPVWTKKCGRPATAVCAKCGQRRCANLTHIKPCPMRRHQWRLIEARKDGA